MPRVLFMLTIAVVPAMAGWLPPGRSGEPPPKKGAGDGVRAPAKFGREVYITNVAVARTTSA